MRGGRGQVLTGLLLSQPAPPGSSAPGSGHWAVGRALGGGTVEHPPPPAQCAAQPGLGQLWAHLPWASLRFQKGHLRPWGTMAPRQTVLEAHFKTRTPQGLGAFSTVFFRTQTTIRINTIAQARELGRGTVKTRRRDVGDPGVL